MCPLRIILIFLSATLAGFFVIRNLKSEPEPIDDALVDPDADADKKKSSDTTANRFSKVCSVVESGFWTFVDMASGKYLWRHLASSSKRSS